MIASRQLTSNRSIDSPPRVVWILGSILLLVIGVIPWVLAGVEAFVQECVIVVITIILAATVLALRGNVVPRFTPTFGVLLLAILFGMLQLVPLPLGVRKILSPGSVRLRAELLPSGDRSDVLPDSQDGTVSPEGWQPLTMSTSATRHDLALLLLAVAVFLLGSSLFATPAAQRLLMIVLAANGAILVFFAIVQKLTWNGLLYWSVDIGRLSPLGPFINQNNAGGYVNICLACAVGLTVWLTGKISPDTSYVESDWSRPPRFSFASLLRPVLRFIGNLNGSLLSAFALAGFLVAGVVCSLSRGAWIAMVAAAVVTALLVALARPRGLRVWLIILVAAVGAGLVGWAGLQDTVYERFATLLDRKMYETHGLLPLWLDSLQAFPEFWPVGSGLGTYRYVYRPYELNPMDTSYSLHAENQYVESLLDGGVVGLLLMLAAIGLVAWSCWRLLRDDRSSRSFAFGVAVTFALASQAVQGFVDFGLYIPANMLLFALMCGAVTGRAAQLGSKGSGRQSHASIRHPGKSRTGIVPAPDSPVGPPDSGLQTPDSGLRTPISGLAIALLLLLGCVWGFREIRQCADLELSWDPACEPMDPLKTPPSHIEKILPAFSRALANRPDDPEGQHHLAQLLVMLYRLQALDQLRKEMPPDFDDQVLWAFTSPEQFHARVHELSDGSRKDELASLRATPVVVENLVPALRALVLSRQACPLLSDVHLMLAQFCGVTADPDTDRPHIARASQCSPAMPDLLNSCGVLDYQSRNYDSAFALWRRVIAIAPDRAVAILDLIARSGKGLEPSEYLQKVLPDSPELLVRLARERYAAEKDSSIQQYLLARTEQIVASPTFPPAESHYFRGAIQSTRGDYAKAVPEYLQAIDLDPNPVLWHYELAIALRHTRDLPRALDEAKWCARHAPSDPKYKQLLKELYDETLGRKP